MTTPPRQLDYASSHTATGGRRLFRTALASFAVAGILANLAFIYFVIVSLHEAHWAYRSLMQNPTAHNREIDPITIASLRQPWDLWAASEALVLASAVGFLLAIHLLVLVTQISRRPERALVRANQYRRWKPVGATLTAATLYWFLSENSGFWVAATRHLPVGSRPPYLEAGLVAACALIPWWWLRHRSDGRSGS